MELELATNEQLIKELRSRYMASVVIGVRSENIQELDVMLDGPQYMLCGLLHQSLHHVTVGEAEFGDE